MAEGARRTRLPRPWFERRLGDFVIACGLIILVLPLMILVAIAVKCDSRGPVFVWVPRTGPFGRPFSALRFRVAAYGVGICSDGISELTFVGGIIHAVRLDLLPQLLNVLRGEMTCLPGDSDRLFFLE